ncbi:MAG: DUF359 domain-containing protein [Pyrobaculum sp.]|jgi:uncharacterized protein (UPF0218 family)
MICFKISKRRDLFAFPYPVAIWKEPPRSIEIVKELLRDYGIEKIYTVGDVVTNNFIKYGIIPTSAAIDEKTKREVAIEVVWPNGEVLKVINPPGYITEEAWSAVEKAVARSILLKVDGEEDMLSLAFIVLAPPKSLVAYGHYAGALIVVLVDWYRDAILKLFNYLEKC